VVQGGLGLRCPESSKSIHNANAHEVGAFKRPSLARYVLSSNPYAKFSMSSWQKQKPKYKEHIEEQ
jgi:hypothetical protein